MQKASCNTRANWFCFEGKNWSVWDTEMRWPQEKKKNDKPSRLTDLRFFFSCRPPSLVLTGRSLHLVTWPRILCLSRAKRSAGSRWFHPVPRKGVNGWRAIIPPFRIAGCNCRRGRCPIGATLGKYVPRTSISAHKSDWMLAWKTEVIIWDNQAFTLLMLERWGVGELVGLVYAKERRKEEKERWPGRRLQRTHNPQQGLQEKKKTAADTHLRRIYNWSASLGGLSTCFMTGTMRGVISVFFFFYVRHLQSAKTPHFFQQRRQLMSEPSRGKVGVKVGSWMEAWIQILIYWWRRVTDTRLMLKQDNKNRETPEKNKSSGVTDL